MSASESNPAIQEGEGPPWGIGLLPLFEGSGYKVLKSGQWDPEHLDVLREYADNADVVYTRWRDEAGNEFPFSPYSRAAHLAGLNFLGTDVCLSPRAAAKLGVFSGNLSDFLRVLAMDETMTFLAVDAVTYTRRKIDAG